MIEVTNGVDTIKVTRGAYEDIFKSQGYHIAEHIKVEPESSGELTEDTEDDITEKPISSWSKDECMTFVEENNIDISDANSPKEIKEIIKDFIAGKGE